jgi:integral membrane protein
VGVMLLALVFVATPLKYLADRPALAEVGWTVHGFLFIVYLLAAFDLGRRHRWAPRRILLVVLAGTVPFLSFVAERRITNELALSTAAKSPL